MRQRYRSFIIQGLLVLLLATGLFINNLIEQKNRLSEEYSQYRAQTESIMVLAHSASTNVESQFLEQYAMERELTCLAMNIYFEAGMKSYDEKLAIATVTINRVKSGIYPNSICGVVWEKKPNAKKCQFSWTCDGKSDRIQHAGKYQQALNVAREVLLNNKKSNRIGQDVLHYHAYYVKPDWSQKMVRVASIGSHFFYKDRTRRG